MKNVPRKLDIRKVIFRIFGQTFSARVVARWGHLGIFGGPWGTLGGPEGKHFHVKKFPQKLYVRELFFRFFQNNFFSDFMGIIIS